MRNAGSRSDPRTFAADNGMATIAALMPGCHQTPAAVVSVSHDAEHSQERRKGH